MVPYGTTKASPQGEGFQICFHFVQNNLKTIKSHTFKPGVLVHTSNPGTWEDVGGLS